MADAVADESVGECEGCGETISHDELYAFVDWQYNCHGLPMNDGTRAAGLWHHECLASGLTFHSPGRIDTDSKGIGWLLHALDLSDRESADG